MESENLDTCKYNSRSGTVCSEAAVSGQEFCCWHSGAGQSASQVKELVEEKVAAEQSLSGFNLSQADLQGAYLIGADLEQAELSRANLTGAHLYGANLRQSNLFKANLSCANLRTANLVDCNLLGANLEDTKLENAEWGDRHIIVNEREAQAALKKGDRRIALRRYREAEEIYRNIKLSHRTQGYGKEEGPFFYREMVVQRKQMPLFSFHRIWSKFMDLTTGYGEKPTRVIITMVCDIVLAALLYGLLGLRYADSYLSFGSEGMPLGEKLFNLLYFSTVVFTTVGFGEITPVGASKGIMMLQGLSGQILIAFFIVTLYKKLMSR
jgi:tetratricopeptide (TPR) repeat protein